MKSFLMEYLMWTVLSGTEQKVTFSHLPADISEFDIMWSPGSHSKDERFENVHCALI